MAAGSRPPDRAGIVHHWTEKLLIKQHTVSDGEATSTKEGGGGKHAESLSCLSFCLVDECRFGQLCINSQPKIPCCFDPLYCLSGKLDWFGLFGASRSLSKA
jgi:hypothetical protein